LGKLRGAAEQYGQQISDLVSRGCARKLTQKEVDDHQGPVHYNSHHLVIREDKQSTPYRLVFNPAEKFNDISLNQCLMKGPDLLNPIIGVMLKFREQPVGFVGDISKCYHQIRVSEKDAHMTRFLWRDMETNRSPDIYITELVTFGMKPAPAMANVALELTADEGAGTYPEASEVIRSCRYMDDIADSRPSVEEVIKLTKDSFQDVISRRRDGQAMRNSLGKHHRSQQLKFLA